VSLYLRPREVMLHIIREDAGICARCDKQLSEGLFCWDHRITNPMYRPGPWKLGEDSFPSVRHTDGTLCGGSYWCYPKSKCRACGAIDSLDVAFEAYGDRITCCECGDSHWYSIGD
jgi:hypothetical protein